MARPDDWFTELFEELNPQRWFSWQREAGRHHRRRRGPMFGSGEMKYVILELLREKPRHGYEVMKALEERMAGCYAPSAGTVYPTLQLLEDQGLVRGVETEGKRVYHITPEGEAFLDEHRDVLRDILDRVRDTLRDVAGGTMGELNQAFGRLTAVAFKEAWRRGPDDPATREIITILQRAAQEITDLRAATSRPES